jgi:hypothetical protein
VDTDQYNKSNEINRITAWKGKPQELIHSNNVTSVRSDDMKNRKIGETIYTIKAANGLVLNRFK